MGTVMVLMAGGIGGIIYQSGKTKYNPKPAALASYTIHAGSAPCLAKLLTKTSGLTEMPSLSINSFLQLKEIAEKCGGKITLDKN